MPNSKHRKSLIRFRFPVITDSDENCSSLSIDTRFDIIDLYEILRPNCRNRSVKFHICLSPPSRKPYPAKIPIYRIPVASSFGKQAEFRTYGINIHDTPNKFNIDSHHQLQQTDFFSRTSSTYWLLVSRVTAVPDHTQRKRERNTYTTVGRAPLGDGSARRKDLYLTTHKIHNRHSTMTPEGFEPAIPAQSGRRPRPQTARPLRSSQ